MDCNNHLGMQSQIDEKAISWFKKAAEQGHTEAQEMLKEHFSH